MSLKPRADFFSGNGPEEGIDLTDGLRVSFRSGVILHLRPSGNAPELRCYAEAGDTETAAALRARHTEGRAGGARLRLPVSGQAPDGDCAVTRSGVWISFSSGRKSSSEKAHVPRGQRRSIWRRRGR